MAGSRVAAAEHVPVALRGSPPFTRALRSCSARPTCADLDALLGLWLCVGGDVARAGVKKLVIFKDNAWPPSSKPRILGVESVATEVPCPLLMRT
jgi:hypothetical protein